MTSEHIRELIAGIRFAAGHFESPHVNACEHRDLLQAADAMEKLLAVYEAACFLPLKADSWAGMPEVKRLQAAIDTAQNRQQR